MTVVGQFLLASICLCQSFVHLDRKNTIDAFDVLAAEQKDKKGAANEHEVKMALLKLWSISPPYT